MAIDSYASTVELRQTEANTEFQQQLRDGWFQVSGHHNAINPELEQQARSIEVPYIEHQWRELDTLHRATHWIDIESPGAGQTLALHIGRQCGSAQVQWGPIGSAPSIIGQAQNRTTSAWSPFAGQQLIPIHFSTATPHRLIVQTQNQNHWAGGLCGDVYIGTLEAINHYQDSRLINYAMVSAMLSMAALYSLAIFAQRRKDKAAMWLAISCFSASMFFYFNGSLLETMLGSTSAWLFEAHYRLMLAAANLVPAAMLMFYQRTFSGLLNDDLMTRNLQLALFCSLVMLCVPVRYLWPVVPLLLLYWSTQFALGLTILSKAILDDRPYAKAMLLAALPIAILVPFELVTRQSLSHLLILSVYATLFFTLVECFIVGRRFSKAFDLAERLSTNLKEEVELQTAELNAQNKKLEKTQHDLKSANLSLKQLSITDGLTGLHNRVHFESEFHKEWRRSSRQQTPISILMVDADNFKRLNDSAGHLVGDLCLQTISREMKNHFKRAGELVARYGGEEFVAMLPETTMTEALKVAEGLRVAIEQLTIQHRSDNYKVTVSIGVSSGVPSMHLSPDNILEAADAALYEAKEDGRNRVGSIPLLAQKSTSIQRRLI